MPMEYTRERMMERIIELLVEIRSRTEKAVQVVVEDTDRAAWLPLALIELDDTGARLIYVRLPQWLAIEKGLIRGGGGR